MVLKLKSLAEFKEYIIYKMSKTFFVKGKIKDVKIHQCLN